MYSSGNVKANQQSEMRETLLREFYANIWLKVLIMDHSVINWANYLAFYIHELHEINKVSSIHAGIVVCLPMMHQPQIPTCAASVASSEML